MASDVKRRLAILMRGAAGAVAMLAVTHGMAFAQMPGMPEMKKMMSWERTLFVLADQLEYSPAGEGKPVSAEVLAWYGNAYDRLWLRAQGEQATTGGQGEGEAEILYGRLVAPFWDAVIGVHVDQHLQDPRNGDPGRVLFAVGLVGLAPYRFELEPTLYVSHRGEISARLQAAYQFLLTQRLIAEPKVEVNGALQAVPRMAVRRGFNDYEVGFRLRYEFRREIAPYVGVSRSRRAGGPAGFAGASAFPAAENRFVAGVRLWR